MSSGLGFVFILLAFTTIYKKDSFKYINQDVGQPTVSPYKSVDAMSIPYYTYSYTGFKESLALRESRGRYRAINTLGYLGRYQFGVSTLALLRIRDIKSFLHKPELQEKALKSYLAYNKWLLQDEIAEYSGQIINGVEITESGILASAHLAGPQNVKRYLRTQGKRKTKDAYGTRVDHYMEEFAHYDLTSVKPLQHPNSLQ
ncbi:MAG: hypothetical protein CSA15_08200 [Candidatus Delongbacteria bacterium]|nr:MAG: hypothetical protein CSA15_08200 [Candidatus Delongbacteria bacterium]